MPYTTLFTLTPRSPIQSAPQLSGQLLVYNWFVGVHATGPPGYYWVPMTRDTARTLYRRKFMVPHLEETLETLYENNRLLFVTGKNYDDSAPIHPYWQQPVVYVGLKVLDLASVRNKQLMVTFDIEAPGLSNPVQLFVGSELAGGRSIEVVGRSKKAVLIDVQANQTLYAFFLRPAGKELYIYSAQVDLSG